MKKKKAISIFLALLSLLLIPSAMLAATVERLAEGVYAFIGKDGSTNSGFIVTEEGVIVIDSQGTRQLAEELKKGIRDVTPKPVIYVVNTHYHGDHTFGNQYFSEARAIIAHENTRLALIERDKAHKERFKKFFGEESLFGFNLTPPTLTFTDKLTLWSGGRKLDLIFAGGPAHTDGDIFVYLAAEKILFAGDLLYKGRLPLLSDGDTAGAGSAVVELLNTGAQIYVPGHGPLADKNDAGEYMGYLNDLRAEVKRLMGEGKTLEEVKKEIKLPKYGGYIRYADWLPLNAEKVYAELLKLEQENRYIPGGEPAPLKK